MIEKERQGANKKGGKRKWREEKNRGEWRRAYEWQLRQGGKVKQRVKQTDKE